MLRKTGDVEGIRHTKIRRTGCYMKHQEYFFRVCIRYLLPQILSFWAIAVQASEMNFTNEGVGGNCDSCWWIAAKGEITPSTPARFERFIKSRPESQCLDLRINSHGGNLLAGIRLGQLFRQYRCSVSVGDSKPMYFNGQKTEYVDRSPGLCTSSCAYAFLGGIQRTVEKGSVLGVHQHYVEGDERDFVRRDHANKEAVALQYLSGLLVSYVIEMGIDPKLITLASRTSGRDEAAAIPRELMVKWKVVTDYEHEPENWTLHTFSHDSGLSAVVVQPQKSSEPQSAMLHCEQKHPGTMFLTLWRPVEKRLLTTLLGTASNLKEVSLGSELSAMVLSATTFNHSGKDHLKIQLSIPVSDLLQLTSKQWVQWEGNVWTRVSEFFTGKLPVSNLNSLMPFLQRNCSL